MSFKYTPNTLKKLEELYEEARYIIRYEKGHFNSGYCILEERRVVVVNKFFNTEGRINALIEILSSIQVNEQELGTETLKWYKQLKSDSAPGADATVQTQMDL
jgi:predicted nucleic-acid-binding protein